MNIKFYYNKKDGTKEIFESMLKTWVDVFQQNIAVNLVSEESWYDEKSADNATSVEDVFSPAEKLYDKINILVPEFWKNGGLSLRMLKIPVRIVCKSDTNEEFSFTVIKLCYGNKAEVRLEIKGGDAASFFAEDDAGENITLSALLSEIFPSDELAKSAFAFIKELPLPPKQ